MNIMYPLYRSPHNWVVLDIQTIYDFYNNPIVVVNVMIGTLHVYDKNIFGKNEMRRIPITRWITQKNYHNYLKNEDL